MAIRVQCVRYDTGNFNLILPNEWLTASIGALRTNVAIDTTDVSIFIALSVGPEDIYHISVLRRDDKNGGSNDTAVLSNPAQLAHGIENFSSWELSNKIWWNPASVPCSSYSCVRSCLQEGMARWEACFKDCHGVSL
jgi:hypothetical protein